MTSNEKLRQQMGLDQVNPLERFARPPNRASGRVKVKRKRADDTTFTKPSLSKRKRDRNRRENS